MDRANIQEWDPHDRSLEEAKDHLVHEEGLICPVYD
jgi:hypothetical protein